MSGKRYNKGKIRYDLIPTGPMKYLGDTYTKGAHKYTLYKDSDGNFHKGSEITIKESLSMEVIDSGANNWRKGLSFMETIASVERHISDWKVGKEIDEDLGTANLSNAAWGLFSLLELGKTHPEKDDRPFWFSKRFKKVVLDLDGVVGAFEEHLINKGYIDKDIPVTHWQDPRIKPILNIIRQDKEFWVSMPLLIDVKNLNYPIAGYCTARSIPLEWIEEWMLINLIPLAPILKVDFGESKSKVLKEFGCDIMIDDSIENFVDLNSSGISCFLKTRTHNKNYNVGNRRIDNLEIFLNSLQV